MKTTALFISLLLSGTATAQLNLDLTSVPSTDTSQLQHVNFFYNYPKLSSITKSVNLLEIRLYTHGQLSGDYCKILSFDGAKWNIEQYDKSRFAVKRIQTSASQINFITVMDSLKSNQIFTLPHQSELQLSGGVDCGTHYLLAYKAGTKFRTYTFSNPSAFLDMNPDCGPLQNYINVIRIFDHLPDK